MELVTVVYSEEKELIELQAYTINRFISEPCIHWVIIEDQNKSKQYWHNLLDPYYTKHELRLVTDTSDINLWIPKKGWIRQQFLKLVVATKIKSEYYLILDAKNFFIKTTDLNIWPPITEGSPRAEKDSEISVVWGKFIDYVISSNDWKLPEYSWGPYTPFRAKTSTVKEILELNLKELIQGLNLKIPGVGTFSEFILYSLYVSNTKGVQITKDLNDYDFTITIWRPENWTTFWKKLSLEDKTTYFKMRPELSVFGVHRLVWENRECAVDISTWLLDIGFDKDVLQRSILKRYVNQKESVLVRFLNRIKNG